MEITQHSIEERNRYDISNVVVNIKRVKMLTIHGDKDDVVPVDDADRFNELIVDHTKKIIPGANHNFNGLLHLDTIVSVISAFLSAGSC